MPEFAENTPPSSPVPDTAAITAAVTQALNQPRPVDDPYAIVDPSTPAPKTSPAPAPEPARFPGAMADAGYTPELLGRAQAAGITEAQAKQTPVDVLSRLLTPAPSYPPASAAEPAWPTPQQIQQGLQSGYVWDGYDWQPIPRPAAGSSFQDLRSKTMRDPVTGEEVAVHQGIVEAFEERDRAYQSQMRQLSEQLAESQRQVQQVASASEQREAARLNQLLSESISADQAYGDVYAQPASRRELEATMNSMMWTRRQMQLPTLSHQELYQRARDAAFGSRARAQADEAVSQQVRNAAGQFVARPSATTRTASTDIDNMPAGEEKAIRRLEQAMRNGR